MQGKDFGYVLVGKDWIASVKAEYIEAVKAAVEKQVAATFNRAND